MQVTPKKQIFLVGCPRSGTTLSQSILAAHPQIASIPESHIFRILLSHQTPRRRKLGLVSSKTRSDFEQFLHEIAQDKMRQYIPKFGLFPYQYFQAFIKILDI